MQGKQYIPVTVCAILLFLLLVLNPKWLKSQKYGDQPKGCVDPLMTSLLILLVGLGAVYCVNSGSMN